MIPLTYQEKYSQKSFHDLIRVLGEPTEQSSVKLDKNAGEGSIQVLDVEEGLQIRIWDCTLSTPLTIRREGSSDSGDKSFTLVYYMTPGTFNLECCTGKVGTINRLWNTVLMSSDAEFCVQIAPNLPMKCLSLNFTLDWLKQYILTDKDFNGGFFEQHVHDVNPFVIFESMTTNEEHVIANLFQNKTLASFGKFFYRSKALNLLTEFIGKIKGRASMQQGTTLYHEEQVIHAEKKLMENITSSLPDLRQLASELAISESTLKRYFKKIYGKNIYEYFLEKKMAAGRQMLDGGKNSVTEIAYMLGYEKASQFIVTFKRIYGVRPGVYKQTFSSAHVA